ncbi:hypothetical protein ACFR99_15070 [Haloarchaeobius amylolyticus]|uniref:Uncharacterized protein n=1 Tax=Haloarchaeobius amylolyticus TaxID=1198296 RepID=A0ABD6BJA5_9EURY
MILILGFVFYLVGIYFGAATIGIEGDSLMAIDLISTVMKETGTACGTLGGITTLINGGFEGRN